MRAVTKPILDGGPMSGNIYTFRGPGTGSHDAVILYTDPIERVLALMATEAVENIDRLPAAEIQSTVSSVKKMLVVGAVFVGVGYLLIGAALFLELTESHPLLEAFFSEQTAHSLAGGGPDRAGDGALNAQLAAIHKFPSLLLWLKLGGIGHILVGIFVALAAIVRVLSLMPHRLSYEMERTQGSAASAVDASAADD